VKFVISGTVDSFDSTAFLSGLASLAKTAASNLYIKSISGGSVVVVVGVLPAASNAVESAVTSASVAELSSALGVTVSAAPTVEKLYVEPKADDNTMFIILGAAVGSFVLVVLATYCICRNSSLETERRISLLKMEEDPYTKQHAPQRDIAEGRSSLLKQDMALSPARMGASLTANV